MPGAAADRAAAAMLTLPPARAAGAVGVAVGGGCLDGDLAERERRVQLWQAAELGLLGGQALHEARRALIAPDLPESPPVVRRRRDAQLAAPPRIEQVVPVLRRV